MIPHKYLIGPDPFRTGLFAFLFGFAYICLEMIAGLLIVMTVMQNQPVDPWMQNVWSLLALAKAPFGFMGDTYGTVIASLTFYVFLGGVVAKLTALKKVHLPTRQTY
jgi:hypothetical protein